MGPTTLATERMVAEWATLMASLASLAFWASVGFVVLMATIVGLSALLPARGADTTGERSSSTCP
jgi:hypothetical protein